MVTCVSTTMRFSACLFSVVVVPLNRPNLRVLHLVFEGFQYSYRRWWTIVANERTEIFWDLVRFMIPNAPARTPFGSQASLANNNTGMGIAVVVLIDPSVHR